MPYLMRLFALNYNKFVGYIRYAMLTYSTVTATIGSKDHYNQLKL